MLSKNIKARIRLTAEIIGFITIIIIIGCFIQNIIKHPYMKLIVQYDDVPAIENNLFFFPIDIHYRGYDVGDVTKVRLSKTQKHIEFLVNITYKDLKIPKNSSFIFKTENIYGSRYLDINPPQTPSRELLKDGDVIDGLEVYERIDEYLTEEIKSGPTSKFIHNLLDITDVLRKSLDDKNNKKLLEQSSGDLAVILENLRQVTADPAFKRDLKSTVKYSSGSLKSIDEILQNQEIRQTISNAPTSVSMTTDNIKMMNENMEKMSKAMPEMTSNVSTANKLLCDTNCNLCAINTKVPPIPQSLVDNAEELVVKTNCFESEISKLISKRFLFLRLMFANPGKSFKVCEKKGCKRLRCKAAN